MFYNEYIYCFNYTVVDKLTFSILIPYKLTFPQYHLGSIGEFAKRDIMRKGEEEAIKVRTK